MARWTPKGWEFYLGKDGDWDISSWEDRPGVDFYEECRARSAVSEQEYFERVVLLECLADACKEKNKKPEEAGFVNPNKVWRSLALMQRKIFAESSTEESFQRTGPGVVVSKIEKYIQEIDEQPHPLPIEQDKKGVIVIPAGSFTLSNDERHVRKMKSFGGGSQLHLTDGEGYVTYDIPSEITIEDDKKYLLSAKVCSVHLEQQHLQFEVDGGEAFSLEVPYTTGEWETTKPTEVIIGGMKQLKVARNPSPTCFGLAIQSFTFTPC